MDVQAHEDVAAAAAAHSELGHEYEAALAEGLIERISSEIDKQVDTRLAQRGIEPVPQFVEAYQDTCNGLGTCVNFSGTSFAAPGINSWGMNNLCYKGGCVGNSGSGNTVSNNSANTAADPGFINGSGTFSTIPDFTPTANYSGAADGVPVYYDALGVPWSPDWELGAIHP